MDSISAQQSSLLKKGPVDVKAKARSVTAVTQTGNDSVSFPTEASPLPVLGNMKEKLNAHLRAERPCSLQRDLDKLESWAITNHAKFNKGAFGSIVKGSDAFGLCTSCG